jgi:hypothetical protein
MENIIDSIIVVWKNENPKQAMLPIGSTQVKYKDDACGIYTIYFTAGLNKIKVKAIKILNDTWKITELT